MSLSSQRGPISAIIRATTNQDIRACGKCQPCCINSHPDMDLTVGEMLQLAARDESAVFISSTLWNCDSVITEDGHCQEGINLSLVIKSLRNEAKLRGYSNNKHVTAQK
jgi:heterodisulfide reductase subunit C